MALINNQDVIQKLVDELRLYPAKDKVPTELADKILPVFQVNSEEVVVKAETATIVESAEAAIAGNTTDIIYTAPTTGKTYLTNVSICASATDNDTNAFWVEVTIDGVAKKLLILSTYNATDYTAPQHNPTLSLNLQNPLLIDKGVAVNLMRTSAADCASAATIVGYHIAV